MDLLLQGMPVRMAILDHGLVDLSQGRRPSPISGYLIQTSAGENVLIDSGLAAAFADDAVASQNNPGGSTTARPVIPAQLALLGIAPQDLHLVIRSNAHITHSDFMHGLSDVPIVIGAVEQTPPRPCAGFGAQAKERPDAPVVVLNRDTPLGPGFDALSVPGRTPDQLAFALHLPHTGPVLLTCDAIACPADLDTGFVGASDPEGAVRHAHRLLQRAVRDRSMVIYGNNLAQWTDLRKAPDFYE